MPIATKYLFIVSMDVTPEKEALFNEIYDGEHIPNLLKVPGVRSAIRLRTERAPVDLGGEVKILTGEGAPTYMAIYEIDSPAIVDSKEWEVAGAWGDWATKIRPHTTERHHSFFEKL